MSIMNKLKTRLAGIAAILLLAAVPLSATVMAPVAVGAQSAKQQICSGIGNAADAADPTKCGNAGGPSVEKIIKVVVNILSFIAGVVAVIMIIISGIKYTTSGGDSSQVTSAKNTLLYAIVGLIIVALAQIIVRFTLGEVR